MGAHQVGLNKRIRPCYRAINVTLGGEVHQSINVIINQGLADSTSIADVALYKMQLSRGLKGRQAGSITRISQGIVGHYGIVGVRLNPVINEVRANKPCGSSHH
jgi:hypothetical protein